jgi:DNA-binding response OmpR family regulator
MVAQVQPLSADLWARPWEVRQRGSSRPILLVEHYSLLAKPLMRGLEEEGIVTHLARSDAEGDARVRATPYAAVVVDWHIPRQGGAALVRSWRRAGLTVPVLALLSSADEADCLLGLAAGADAVLPMPFTFADLLARVRTWTAPPGAWPTAVWPGRG